jgi:tryptophan-rich sensory protein
MRKRFSSSDWFKFVIAVVACELAGAIGSIFSISAIPTWYATLAKPALNPPGWIFGPVWTTLYLLMGVAAFLVWRKGWERKDIKIVLSIFGGQLVLNALWSIIFFGLHSPAWAFVDIIAMWIVIVATIATFAKISRSAAWLLAPYILWVSFALYLNYAIWRLN